MFSGPKPRKPLSDLEQLVMHVLWTRSSATAEEVRLALICQHPMKESTTRTILKRLEEKGYVRRSVQDRVNVYTGLMAPERVAANAVRQILARFCGGSMERLLVGIVADEVIDEKELQRLADRIASRNTAREA
jgi:BlaI family transcriptional regulator, penicillinase repressor